MTRLEYICWSIGLILLIGGGVTWLERRLRYELRMGWDKNNKKGKNHEADVD